MAVIADLRATAHQGMGIDHGSLAHPATGVDEHGRHAGDALADKTTIANRGAAGHDTHTIIFIQLLHGPSGFIEPRLPGAVDGAIHDAAQAEAGKVAFFHPRVDAPAGKSTGVGLGRANLAEVQSFAEIAEELKVRMSWLLRIFVEQALDLSLHARSGRPSARPVPELW